MTKDELKGLLVSHGLASLADTIISSAVECVRLISMEEGEDDIPVGASKIGGVPDLPTSIEWPRLDSGPLAFLAQIDLSKLPRMERISALPSSGHLSFFYDADHQPWGFDPKDAGSWKVIYTPEGQGIERRQSPKDLSRESRFDSRRLAAEKCYSLPGWERQEAHSLSLSESQCDSY